MVELRLVPGTGDRLTDTLDLWDYRRRVESLYAEVRRLGAGEQAWRMWRRARDELFATHPQSPLGEEQQASFTGLPYFPYDPSWRFLVEVEPAPPGTLDNADASSRGLLRFGVARFSRAGHPFELSLYWLDGYAGGVFLPFSDATSGVGTYGGGRYLLDTAKGADLGRVGSRMVLDFNFAYHPSCAHDARWSCPLAPSENSLDRPVTAGEGLSPARRISSRPARSASTSPPPAG